MFNNIHFQCFTMALYLTFLFFIFATAAAKSLQSCPTLCDPIDGSPPRSPVPGILQARTLEWVAISFSSAWKWKVKVKSLSRVRLLATPWTVAHQAPPSMGFSRQEYWSGLPLPSPRGCYLGRWQLSVPSESVTATEHYVAMNTTLPGEFTSSEWSQRGNCGSPNQGGTRWDNSWQATLAPEFPIRVAKALLSLHLVQTPILLPFHSYQSFINIPDTKILSQHLLIDPGTHKH